MQTLRKVYYQTRRTIKFNSNKFTREPLIMTLEPKKWDEVQDIDCSLSCWHNWLRRAVWKQFTIVCPPPPVTSNPVKEADVDRILTRIFYVNIVFTSAGKQQWQDDVKSIDWHQPLKTSITWWDKAIRVRACMLWHHLLFENLEHITACIIL